MEIHQQGKEVYQQGLKKHEPASTFQVSENGHNPRTDRQVRGDSPVGDAKLFYLNRPDIEAWERR